MSVLDRMALPYPAVNISYPRATTLFGPRTLDLGKGPFANMHDGIDFAIGRNQPARSAGDGVVIVVLDPPRKTTTIGKAVVVDHGEGWWTRYHMLDSVAVTKGEQVKRGQRLGGIGDSGTGGKGVHLHFELRGNNVPVDPLIHLGDAPRALAASAPIKTTAEEHKVTAFIYRNNSETWDGKRNPRFGETWIFDTSTGKAWWSPNDPYTALLIKTKQVGSSETIQLPHNEFEFVEFQARLARAQSNEGGSPAAVNVSPDVTKLITQSVLDGIKPLLRAQGVSQTDLDAIAQKIILGVADKTADELADRLKA